jgi:hypothetical protein
MTSDATTAADQNATPITPEPLCDRALTTSGAAGTTQRRSQRVRSTVCVPAASATATHRARRRYLVGSERPL